MNNIESIAGYAAVFHRPGDDTTQADLGDFVERIRPGAFAKALARGGAIASYTNHDPNYLLGREGTEPVSLVLHEDGAGLHVRCFPFATAAGRDAVEMVRVGGLRGMSFGFSMADGQDEWALENGKQVRTISTIGQLYDASPCVHPAYRGTSCSIEMSRRSLARSLARHEDQARRTYDPNQPRDPDGKWTAAGFTGGAIGGVAGGAGGAVLGGLAASKIAAIGGGLVGAVAGAGAGTFFGPQGIAIGAILGGAAGTATGQAVGSTLGTLLGGAVGAYGGAKVGYKIGDALTATGAHPQLPKGNPYKVVGGSETHVVLHGHDDNAAPVEVTADGKVMHIHFEKPDERSAPGCIEHADDRSRGAKRAELQRQTRRRLYNQRAALVARSEDGHDVRAELAALDRQAASLAACLK